MPDSVTVHNPHVAHLNREVGLKGWLPDPALEDVSGDSEWRSGLRLILDHVDSGFSHIGKVEDGVSEAEKPSPLLERCREDLSEALLRVHAQQYSFTEFSCLRIQLDDCTLNLVRMITDLGDADDGFATPSLDAVWRNQPLDCSFCRTRRHN